MALPGSRRPPEVEEFLEPQFQKSGLLKIRINLQDVFMEEMVTWFHRLSTKLKKALTKKRIIRRAQRVAYNLRFPYNRLNPKWLKILHENHGVKFKLPKSRGKPWYWRKQPECSARIKFLNFLKFMAKLPRLDGQFIDLTQEPPETKWLRKYIKGEAPPRQLVLHEDFENDRQILFYNYDVPKTVRVKIRPFAGDGVFPHPQ